MPIYEYLCEACGTLTERMQKVSEPGPRKCPECGSRKIAKLVSRTSFQLKGGGWYSDLYASPRPDGAKAGTHGADGKGETKADGKAAGEVKAEGKADAKEAAAGKVEPKPAEAPKIAKSDAAAPPPASGKRKRS